jgi:hypothetical protein
MENNIIMNESEVKDLKDTRRVEGSAFITDNPDFDPSRDVPEARGCDIPAGIIANSYKGQ